MYTTEITCAHCGNKSMKPNSAVNRARRDGKEMFCGRGCFAAFRITKKEDKLAKKRVWASKFREENADEITQYNREWAANHYDIKTKHGRENRRKKKEYDERHRLENPEMYKAKGRRCKAKRRYGDYAEVWFLLRELRQEVLSKHTDYELRRLNETDHKTRKRNIKNEETISTNFEISPMGNTKQG